MLSFYNKLKNTSGLSLIRSKCLAQKLAQQFQSKSCYPRLFFFDWFYGVLIPFATLFQLHSGGEFYCGENQSTRRKPLTCRKSQQT